MTDTEAIAKYVQNNAEAYASEVNAAGRNSMVPPPPKPGELMYCQLCGKPMYPQDFSKDIKIRKREFKWQVHSKCEEDMWKQMDNSMPGLMAERKQRGNRPQETMRMQGK